MKPEPEAGKKTRGLGLHLMAPQSSNCIGTSQLDIGEPVPSSLQQFSRHSLKFGRNETPEQYRNGWLLTGPPFTRTSLVHACAADRAVLLHYFSPLPHPTLHKQCHPKEGSMIRTSFT